ncbi:hypothetical protein Tco_0966214 [Tanacetum coccineum]
MHIFVGNFDFMIVEDISSIIDPRLSQVVLGKPFVKISNMTHDLSLGIVRFANGTDEIAYKMPHKIEQFNSLTDLGKEHTKSVYFRNMEDKRRGVEYVMNKILGFYKKCLELGPEYLTGLEEGESGINKKTEKPSQNDKTRAWNGKDCAESRPKSSHTVESQSNRAGTEEYYMGMQSQPI